MHPDVNPSPNAHEQYSELNGAYETLKDPKKREMYDMYGTADPRSIPNNQGRGGMPFGGMPFGGGPFGGGFQQTICENGVCRVVQSNQKQGGMPFGSFQMNFGGNPRRKREQQSNDPFSFLGNIFGGFEEASSSFGDFGSNFFSSFGKSEPKPKQKPFSSTSQSKTGPKKQTQKTKKTQNTQYKARNKPF